MMINKLMKNDSLFIKVKKNESYILKSINVNYIIYVKASRDYCYIHMLNELYKIKGTLEFLDEKLRTRRSFVRVNRSYVVNFKYVKSIIGKKEVVLDSDYQIVIGSTYLKRVISKLNII